MIKFNELKEGQYFVLDNELYIKQQLNNNYNALRICRYRAVENWINGDVLVYKCDIETIDNIFVNVK